jgi:hypothetical protein
MILSPKPIKPNLFSWKGQEHAPLVLFDKQLHGNEVLISIIICPTIQN